MRRVVLRSLLVIGIGGAVLAGVLYVASTVDARAPEVLGIAVTQQVGDDPELALITTSIEIEFNEPVETDAADALRIEPEVDGSASWSGSTLIFTPDEPLDLETAYTVTIDAGIRDLAGNEMVEVPPPFEFATAGRPLVVVTAPEDGAAGVPVDGTVAITFTSLMDTTSVEEALRIRPAFSHELRWSGELLEIVPDEPFEPDTEYEIAIGPDATDAAGVAIGSAFTLRFQTVQPGLRAETIVPADGLDGVAPATAIAVIFDGPLDPSTIRPELLVITPEVAGTLDVVSLPGDPPTDESGSGRVLRFVPSAALPPTTTFEVRLEPGVLGLEGRGLAEPLSWTFTTGAPITTISNQVTFLTDRSGVTNVWTMNLDGTGQRQVSSELAPVVDYAVAPDGSSLVVGDGRQLVHLRPDGTDRRVLTGTGHLEFDPTYSPNGQRIAFARADAASGGGLGLWAWTVGGGDAEPFELPSEIGAPPTPSATSEPRPVLRSPRYAPDGLALAFVDSGGAVGILELPAQRLTRIALTAATPPIWLPDSSALLVSGLAAADPAGTVEAPVLPLAPDDTASVYRIARSGTVASETALLDGRRVIGVALDGTIAYVTAAGWLLLTPDAATGGDDALVSDGAVTGGAFAPGEEAMVVAVATTPDDQRGTIERLDLDSARRTILADEGWHPRWLP